jgi:hypothetical protein
MYKQEEHILYTHTHTHTHTQQLIGRCITINATDWQTALHLPLMQVVRHEMGWFGFGSLAMRFLLRALVPHHSSPVALCRQSGGVLESQAHCY